MRTELTLSPITQDTKLANKRAKHNTAFDGVCRWIRFRQAGGEVLMASLSVVELWGVSTRLTKRLNAIGIRGGPEWSMKRGMRSPRYTTHWDELPLVKAA